MSDPTDIAARTQRFNEAVRAFTRPTPSRHAKLMPYKDGIMELRQKGGSLRLIRELLATINVAVGTDTIARFLTDVTGAPEPQRSTRRSRRGRVVAPSTTCPRPVVVPSVAPATTSLPLTSQSPPPAPVIAAQTERPRSRGPRIADPTNL